MKYALVLESGYLVKWEFNPDVPKVATIEEIIEMQRLFKFDMKVGLFADQSPILIPWQHHIVSSSNKTSV